MFAAIFMRKPGSDPRDIVSPDALEDALSLGGFGDVRGHYVTNRVLMAQSTLWNTPESKYETAPEVCPDTGRVIVSWVRLDNREALCAALGLPSRDTLTDPQILLAAHRMWGPDCAKRLEGDFSFVIHDPTSGAIFAARDVVGAVPLYWLETDTTLILCTSQALFKSVFKAFTGPNPLWVTHYTAGLISGPDLCAFSDVQALAGGVRLGAGLNTTTLCHEFRNFEEPFRDEAISAEEAVATYRTALDQAVRDRLRTAYPVAVESSGGVDSSAIIGSMHANGWLAPDTLALSMCHMEEEPEVLLQMALHVGLRRNFVLARPMMFGTDNHLDAAEAALGHPLEHPHPTFFGPAIRYAAQDGARVLMSGYGGDEIVSNNGRNALIWWRAHRRYGAMFRATGGNPVLKTYRFLRSMLRNGKTDEIARWVNTLIDTSALTDNARADLAPFRQPENEQQLWAADPNTALTQALLFKTHRYARLEACTLVGRSLGVEFRWPLFDPRLIKVYLQSPLSVRHVEGIGRFLHRSAMSPYTPPKIAWRNRKSMGDTHFRVSDMDYEPRIEFDALPELLRQVLDPEKIARLNETLPALSPSTPLRAETFEDQKRVWYINRIAKWRSQL
ncbi:asparagine synthase-related protein [Gymnodinialimonas sp.]